MNSQLNARNERKRGTTKGTPDTINAAPSARATSLPAPLAPAPLLTDAAPRSRSIAQPRNRRTHGQNTPWLIAGGATEVVGAEEERQAADPGAGGTDGARGTTEGGSESMGLTDPTLQGWNRGPPTYGQRAVAFRASATSCTIAGIRAHRAAFTTT